jgi:hypothetical protein
MKRFENLGKKLSKDEQKNILGGGFSGGGGGLGSCPGIIECPTLEIGQACPDVGSSTGCTCREDPQDGKMCLP